MKKPPKLRVFELETILVHLAKKLAVYWRTEDGLEHINYTEAALGVALGDDHPAIVELAKARAEHEADV